MLRVFLSILVATSLSFSAIVSQNALSDGFEFELSFSAPDTVSVLTPHGKFTALFMDEHCQYEISAGAPKLPVYVYVLGIPPDGNFKLDYTAKWADEIKLEAPVVPADSVYWENNVIITMPMPPKDEFYRARFALPEKPVEAIDNGFLRSQRIVKLVVHPVKYNPFDNTLVPIKSLRIKINFTPSGTFVDEGAYERIFRALLVNYEQARYMRFLDTLVFPRPPFEKASRWIRVSLREGGVFAITRDWLLSHDLNPDSIGPDDIRIFSPLPGVQPPNLSAQFPELREIPAISIGDGGHVFDDFDSLIFYNMGPRGWSAILGVPLWHDSPYCDSFSVWVALGGSFEQLPKRLTPATLPAGNDTANWGWAYVHYGEDENYDYDKGWYWREIEDYLTVFLNDERIRIHSGDQAKLIATPEPYRILCNGVETGPNIDNLIAGNNEIRLVYNATVQIKKVEIAYQINLKPTRHMLHFYTNNIDAGPRSYVLSGFSEIPFVLAVSNIWQTRLLEVVPYILDSLAFNDTIQSEEYVVFERAAIKELPRGVFEEGFWLSNPDSLNVDYLIITPHELDPSLLAKLWRDKGLRVRIVPLEGIMREFAFGRYDPTAIRNFIRYAYNVALPPKPQYVLFVGDGHFDLKHKLTDEPILFPPAVMASNYSDAFYATITDNVYRAFELMSGRIPVKNQFQLNDVMDKTIKYTKAPFYGEWRIRTVPAADDEYRDDGRNDHLGYTRNTSDLISNYLPLRSIADPLYLIDYPRTSSLRKPKATEALMRKVNDGALWVNWIGHGNYHLWAHERLQNFPADLPKWQNWRMPSLVTAFSCEVSRFYKINGKECMTEELIRKPQSGAIATIAATGGTFAGSNFNLCKRIVRYLFYTDSLSIAGALVASRTELYPSHDAQYIYFGDPALTLGFPYTEIALSMEPDTLKAAQWVTISGDVAVPFDGEAKIFLLGPRYYKHYDSPVAGVGSVDYIQEGKILFSGVATVRNGHFELPIFVPKNLSSWSGYRIIAYAYSYSETLDASGVLVDVPAEPSESVTVSDTTGPEIRITFDRDVFVDGGTVCSPDGYLPVTVYFSDSHCINMGTQPGQEVILQLDSPENKVDISSSLVFARDNPTQAVATYTFENVEYGGHTICVQAWDNLGNVSVKCVDLWLDPCQGDVYSVVPYPNPFSDEVKFTFALAGDDVQYADAELLIFAPSGDLIRKLTKSTTETFDYISWDGRNSSGKELGRGIYIYVLKLTLHTKFGNPVEKIFRGKVVKR